MCSTNGKIIHLFHWPSFREYQESLLQVIALPIGAKGQLYYRAKWVNDTFINEIEYINKCNGFGAIFWVLSCTQTQKNDEIIVTFDFACPIRLLKILKVEKRNDYYYIDFIAQKFVSEFKKMDTKALSDCIKIEFDSQQSPYPGIEKSYVYLGPKIDIETSNSLSLESLYEVLKNIPCSLGYKEGITIKEYPLLKIETIEKSKIDESGVYKLLINREYNVTFSYYQSESYRDRKIDINGNRFIGKSVTNKISIAETRKKVDKIDIKVESANINFKIPLNVLVKVPWYKFKIVSLFFIFIISGLAVFIFWKLFPESSIEIKTALIFPLIVMFLDKIWEVLTK